MAVTNYHTVNGRIRGESTSGVRTDYLTDALGSVVATVNSSAAVVNTYRYKPYGARLAKTGVGADPKFQWTGEGGSRRSSAAYADQHNRARHYATAIATWTSIDRTWPGRPALVYAFSNPVFWTDPSGLAEEYVRVRYTGPGDVVGVAGQVSLPRSCHCKEHNTKQEWEEKPDCWIDAYVSFLGKWDCGISYKCGRKPHPWMGWLMRKKTKKEPEVREYIDSVALRQPVDMMLYGKFDYPTRQWYVYCAINGVSKRHLASPGTPPWIGQVVIGAGTKDTKHSTMQWGSMQIAIGSDRWGTPEFQPWIREHAGSPEAVGLYRTDGVDSRFPLGAHHGQTETPCTGCVEKTEMGGAK